MTGLVVIMAVITCDDKFSVIGEALGLKAIAHMPPAIIAPIAGKPFILGISEQDLTMLWWPQNVASQPFGSRRDEGATMRMTTRQSFGNSVRQPSFPVHMDACFPLRLHLHLVEFLRQPVVHAGKWCQIARPPTTR